MYVHMFFSTTFSIVWSIGCSMSNWLVMFPVPPMSLDTMQNAVPYVDRVQLYYHIAMKQVKQFVHHARYVH